MFTTTTRALWFLLGLQLSSSVAWIASAETLQESIEKYVAEAHLDPELVRPAELAAEAKARSAGPGGRAEAIRWVQGQIFARTHGSVPIAPEVDRSFQYRLPYDSRIPRLIGQAAGGEFSHTGSLFHSIDFVLPLGTEVRAARRGRVALVVDGFTERGLDREEAHRSNVVVILHKDGSFARYAHLAPGIPVKLGDQIKGGQVIGISDQTGFAEVPHLHFDVWRRLTEAEGTTIPVRFRAGGGAGSEALIGTFYFRAEPQTAKLSVRAEGVDLKEDEVLSTNWGDSVTLRVELKRGGAAPVDVTESESLLFHSVTPQCLVVAGPGEVRIAPSEGFEPLLGSKCLAVLWLAYRDRERGDVAYLNLLLPVEPASPAPG